MRVPPEYTREKLNRFSEKVPPAAYRAVVDVTPGKRGGAHISRSSGSKAVDAVAMDFADAYSTQIKGLREMRRTRELRFPLLFDLRQAVGTWHTELPKGAVSTHTTLRNVGGTTMMRIATGPDGRVRDTRIIMSSGLDRLDDGIAVYARQHWSGPPNSATIVRSYSFGSF